MTNKLKILIGVNLLLVLAIGFSFVNFSSSETKEKEAFFRVGNLGDITAFDIDGFTVSKLEDGRWVMNNNVDVSPQKVGLLFQALQQTQIVSEENKVLTNGKELTIYVANTPVFSAIIKSESDAVSYGTSNGQTFSIEVPGQFVNIEEIFSPDEKEWRDKTLFRTSWRTLKVFDMKFDRNPENNVLITFKDPFYDVKGIQALDSAAVYQFVSSLPNSKGSHFEQRTSFLQDTVSKYKPFCTIKMEDLNKEYNVNLAIYPFGNKVFAYFPDTKEVAEVDPQRIQDVLVSWHFFDANDPRKKQR